jgi:hypothetical protein
MSEHYKVKEISINKMYNFLLNVAMSHSIRWERNMKEQKQPLENDSIESTLPRSAVSSLSDIYLYHHTHFLI